MENSKTRTIGIRAQKYGEKTSLKLKQSYPNLANPKPFENIQIIPDYNFETIFDPVSIEHNFNAPELNTFAGHESGELGAFPFNANKPYESLLGSKFHNIDQFEMKLRKVLILLKMLAKMKTFYVNRKEISGLIKSIGDILQKKKPSNWKHTFKLWNMIEKTPL